MDTNGSRADLQGRFTFLLAMKGNFIPATQPDILDKRMHASLNRSSDGFALSYARRRWYVSLLQLCLDPLAPSLSLASKIRPALRHSFPTNQARQARWRNETL